MLGSKVIPADKVVLDGDMKLILPLDGGMVIHLAMDGEAGSAIKVVQDEDRDIYTGPYVVTPRAEEQALNTDQKYMADDVTVLAIPYVEVSNLNGITVSIG